MLRPGQNRGWHLVNLRGSQNKNGMRGWFLQGFEQRIKSFLGQHVKFIDQEDFFLRLTRSKAHSLAQFSNFVDTAIGGRVDFYKIQFLPLLSTNTRRAFIAGLTVFEPAVFYSLAIDRPRKQTRYGSFSRSAGTRKNIGLTNQSALQ